MRCSATRHNRPRIFVERVVVHYPEGACSLGHDGVVHRHGSVNLPDDYIVGAEQTAKCYLHDPALASPRPIGATDVPDSDAAR